MPHTISRKPVDSSNVAEIGHCSDTNRLTVAYKSGGKYVYHDVPADIHERIVNSDSIGKSIFDLIKGGRFRYEKF